jgi:hypothetical protein
MCKDLLQRHDWRLRVALATQYATSYIGKQTSNIITEKHSGNSQLVLAVVGAH